MTKSKNAVTSGVGRQCRDVSSRDAAVELPWMDLQRTRHCLPMPTGPFSILAR